MRILCIAEKASEAKYFAGVLAGNQRIQRSDGRDRYCPVYEFDYYLQEVGQSVRVAMTSMRGHALELLFPEEYNSWSAVDPVELFTAATREVVIDGMNQCVQGLEQEARRADRVIIWTDCDHEGEFIGYEAANICGAVNRRLRVPPLDLDSQAHNLDAGDETVRRAWISMRTANAINNAMQRPQPIDMNKVRAVAVRRELDLRTGFALTRFQTRYLQNIFPQLNQKVISFGTCQFPTMGFVVDQYLKVKRFVSEPFWSIEMSHSKDNVIGRFNWQRGQLFDEMSCFVLYELCMESPTATVINANGKNTDKWKPLPLTTVELLKLASTHFKMNSERTSAVAESLYRQGIISYPRTETDEFESSFDFNSLIQKQVDNPQWGQYAQNLLHNGINRPRKGGHNDKAHPPIHPVTAAPNLVGDEKKIYELITRRFLACCSENAKGHKTNVTVDIAGEIFTASGLMVLARNYLDVYPYEKWSDATIPVFRQGEQFIPTELIMKQGKTSAPKLLTEKELIAIMQRNGIGTDATIPDHISKVQEREYVIMDRTRHFTPSTLGLGLVEGFDSIGFEMSLSKPYLRQQLEQNLELIRNGQIIPRIVINEAIHKYKSVYLRSKSQASKLSQSVAKYFGVELPPLIQQQYGDNAAFRSGNGNDIYGNGTDDYGGDPGGGSGGGGGMTANGLFASGGGGGFGNCFKCGQPGHFANECTNSNAPSSRAPPLNLDSSHARSQIKHPPISTRQADARPNHLPRSRH
ncbi:prokaryotic type I DNA topoisomerase [Ramicandelaber brevisporus]|nr:prokaryotic type I DNA topoisomerase [Ramicandelaber brevisporus]